MVTKTSSDPSTQSESSRGSSQRSPGRAATPDLPRALGNQAFGALLGAPSVQAKMTVGAVNDPLEHEADKVADQVTRGPRDPNGAGLGTTPQPAVQRRQGSPSHGSIVGRAAPSGRGSSAPGNSFEPGAGFESKLSKGGGSPLPEGTRTLLEPRFGADFSGVRMRTDGESARLNRQIGAQAFTHGSDIYFGAGRGSPQTDSGLHLLAHELTHTIQQGAVPTPGSNVQRASSMVQRGGEGGVATLDEQYRGALRLARENGNWQDAAEKLNSEIVLTRLDRLIEELDGAGRDPDLDLYIG